MDPLLGYLILLDFGIAVAVEELCSEGVINLYSEGKICFS